MKSPSGPSAPWFDEDSDESDTYTDRLALEHARAVLACRLIDRLEIVKRATVETLRIELHRQIVEAAAEGRHSDMRDLMLQAGELLIVRDP